MSILMFLAVIAILEFILLATDYVGASAIVLVAALGILQKGFGVPVTPYLPHHWWSWVLLVLGYFAVDGAGWSMFRFWVECRKRAEWIANNKEGFGTKHHPNMDWNKFVDDNMPSAKTMKSKIFIWIAAWPLSMVHFAAHDMLRELLTTIYNAMRGVYDSIANQFKHDLKD